MKISKNSLIMAASFLVVASQAHAQVSAQKGVSLFEAYQTLKAAEKTESQVVPSDLQVAMGQFELVDAYPIQENGVSLIKVRLQQKDQLPAGSSRSRITKAIVFSLDMLQAGGAAYGVIKTSPKRDKLKHGFAGYAAASFTHGCLELILPDHLRFRRLISVLSGVGASIIAGVGKEYYDSLGYGNVETLDAVATAGGGVGGGVSGGFASAISSAVVGGLISSLTLTIDADRAIQKAKNRRRQPQPF
jgi:hypothetical protein